MIIKRLEERIYRVKIFKKFLAQAFLIVFAVFLITVLAVILKYSGVI